MYKLYIILMTCSQASTKVELRFQKIMVEKLEKVLCHTVQI